MNIDYENVQLLVEIVIEEEAREIDDADFSPKQEDMMDSKIENILVIAEGLTYENTFYMTDVEAEFKSPNSERQKVAYETISQMTHVKFS